MNMQIEQRIREFILKNLYYAEDRPIADDDSFLETGIVDSMGVMELVAFVQSEFGVEPAPDEIVVENFGSIRNLASYVRRKLKGRVTGDECRVTRHGASSSCLKEGNGDEHENGRRATRHSPPVTRLSQGAQ
jgi:acyl carrier protein